ncbi:hypothetical protein HDV00_012741 [Rhizophlyctis rosea]|nr:hypothetical protein HDV00_012741 [Rhizophlyctis rosea]
MTFFGAFTSNTGGGQHQPAVSNNNNPYNNQQQPHQQQQQQQQQPYTMGFHQPTTSTTYLAPPPLPSASTTPSQKPKSLRAEKRNPIWDKRYESSRKGHRHSLKLPIAHKSRFSEPYDEHISYLLNLLTTLYPSPETLPKGLVGQARRSCPSGSSWVVWLSTEGRERYRAVKQQWAGGSRNVTHGEFVELLLGMHDAYLAGAYGSVARVATKGAMGTASASDHGAAAKEAASAGAYGADAKAHGAAAKVGAFGTAATAAASTSSSPTTSPAPAVTPPSRPMATVVQAVRAVSNSFSAFNKQRDDKLTAPVKTEEDVKTIKHFLYTSSPTMDEPLPPYLAPPSSSSSSVPPIIHTPQPSESPSYTPTTQTPRYTPTTQTPSYSPPDEPLPPYFTPDVAVKIEEPSDDSVASPPLLAGGQAAWETRSVDEMMLDGFDPMTASVGDAFGLGAEGALLSYEDLRAFDEAERRSLGGGEGEEGRMGASVEFGRGGEERDIVGATGHGFDEPLPSYEVSVGRGKEKEKEKGVWEGDSKSVDVDMDWGWEKLRFKEKEKVGDGDSLSWLNDVPEYGGGGGGGGWEEKGKMVGDAGDVDMGEGTAGGGVVGTAVDLDFFSDINHSGPSSTTFGGSGSGTGTMRVTGSNNFVALALPPTDTPASTLDLPAFWWGGGGGLNAGVGGEGSRDDGVGDSWWGTGGMVDGSGGVGRSGRTSPFEWMQWVKSGESDSEGEDGGGSQWVRGT